MAKIIAPNKAYNGISASVPFVEGVGETTDAHLIEWFRTHGYEVVEESAAESVEEIAQEVAEEQAEEPEVKPVKRGRK